MDMPVDNTWDTGNFSNVAGALLKFFKANKMCLYERNNLTLEIVSESCDIVLLKAMYLKILMKPAKMVSAAASWNLKLVLLRMSWSKELDCSPLPLGPDLER